MNKVLFPKKDYVKELVRIFKSSKNSQKLVKTLSKYHEKDIAEAITLLTPAERQHIYNVLDEHMIAEIFSYLDDAKDYLEELSLEKAARVVSYMDSDDAVDVLDDLSETKKNEIVEHLDADAKEDVQKLLSYEDDEIGSCMTNNFICIPDNLTIREAMSSLVKQAGEHDNISTIYVVNSADKFAGAIDLKDLIIGSEGTLGIVTKIVLKLLPLPKKNISLLIPYQNLEKAIRTVPRAKAIPTAIEFMEREVICDAEKYLGRKFPDNQADAYLLLKFDGNSVEEIENYYDNVAKICLQQGAIDILIADTDERSEGIWKARGAFLEAIKSSTTCMDEVDIVVPRSEVNTFVEYVHELRAKLNIRMKSFGHAGDGNLHVYILKDDLDDEQWHELLTLAMDKMYAKAKELNGKVSGEHGIGLVKKVYLEQSTPKTAIDLMKKIKAVFDPNNILNPGKIC